MPFHKFLFIILLFLGITSCSNDPLKQLRESINTIQIKQDGLDYRFEVGNYKQSPILKNKKKWYYWFDGKKVLKTEGDFEGRLLNGHFATFYPNNQLQAKGKFNKGIKTGAWRYWNQDGKLIRKETWLFGKPVKTRNILQEEKEEFLAEIKKQEAKADTIKQKKRFSIKKIKLNKKKTKNNEK